MGKPTYYLTKFVPRDRCLLGLSGRKRGRSRQRVRDPFFTNRCSPIVGCREGVLALRRKRNPLGRLHGRFDGWFHGDVPVQHPFHGGGFGGHLRPLFMKVGGRFLYGAIDDG